MRIKSHALGRVGVLLLLTVAFWAQLWWNLPASSVAIDDKPMALKEDIEISPFVANGLNPLGVNTTFIGELPGGTDNRMPLAIVGDVNGDGYDDFLVGATKTESQLGKAYLFYGNGSGTYPAIDELARANVIFEGETTGEYTGEDIAGAGDVNGDGFADILIGAFAKDNWRGKAYLIYGGRNLSGNISLATGANASFLGENELDNFGHRLAGAGDLNRDGYDDFVIGAQGYPSGNPNNKGKIYLIYGNESMTGTSPISAAANASFVGDNNGDFLGTSISRAGDINRDGYPDFLVGAPQHPSGLGKVYLLLGNRSMSGTAPISAAANASFVGENGGDRAGFSIAGVGDVNRDGFADILIGADRYQSDRGKAYLIYGNASLNKDMGLGAANASFVGENPSDWAGNCVAGAGDVNRDGYPDLLIGAYYYPNDAKKGKVYLIYCNGSLTKDMSLNHANASFVGENDNDLFGGYIGSSAGDINGDGRPDIILAAAHYSSKQGKVYLIFGPAPQQTPSATFLGITAGERAGYCVAGAGDVNGDGYDDYLFGAGTYDSNRGRAYLVYGNGNYGLNTSFENANATFTGEAQGTYLGHAVAGIGDINGDGFADILISAHYYNSQQGKTYLFYGSRNLKGAFSLSEANATFIGENTYDESGWALAGVGDINRDGLADFAITAESYPSAAQRGKVYLFYGNRTPSAYKGTYSLASANATFTGIANLDRFGYSVAHAGDVNRDGYPDLLIGAGTRASSQGAVYIFYGNGSLTTDTPANVANASFIGETTSSYTGVCVAGGVDVNRDGFPDIFIGAPYLAGGNTGKAYVVYGNSSLTKEMPLSNANLTFTGENVNDQAGIAIAFAGDVNKDGYHDFLIGAYEYPSGGHQGRAYLVFGNGSLPAQIPLGVANRTFTGEVGGDFFAPWNGVANGGDGNGDGRPDILMSATFYDSEAFNDRGKVYVMYDVAAPAVVTDLFACNPSSSSITLNWTAPGDDGRWAGTVANYTFKYSTNPITADNFDAAATYDTSGWAASGFQAAGRNESRVVTGLTAGTTYYFALKAADEAPNNSSISNVASATTTGGVDTSPPVITGTGLMDGAVYGNAPLPHFILAVTEANPDEQWFSFNGGVTNTSCGTSGDLVGWNLLGNGSVVVSFWTNDTAGNPSNQFDVLLHHDVAAPAVAISAPASGAQLTSAPTLTVTVTDANLHYAWYTLGTSAAKYFFTGASVAVNATAWAALPAGDVAIKVSANDTLGNEAATSVTVTVVRDTNTSGMPQAFGAGSHTAQGTAGGRLRLTLAFTSTRPVQVTLSYHSANPARVTQANAIAFFEVTVNDSAALTFPVTLKLYYDASSDVAEANLAVWTFNDATGAWEQLEATVDTTEHSVTVQVTHFSVFCVAPNAPGAQFPWWVIAVAGGAVAVGAGVIATKKRTPKRSTAPLESISVPGATEAEEEAQARKQAQLEETARVKQTEEARRRAERETQRKSEEDARLRSKEEAKQRDAIKQKLQKAEKEFNKLQADRNTHACLDRIPEIVTLAKALANADVVTQYTTLQAELEHVREAEIQQKRLEEAEAEFQSAYTAQNYHECLGQIPKILSLAGSVGNTGVAARYTDLKRQIEEKLEEIARMERLQQAENEFQRLLMSRNHRACLDQIPKILALASSLSNTEVAARYTDLKRQIEGKLEQEARQKRLQQAEQVFQTLLAEKKYKPALDQVPEILSLAESLKNKDVATRYSALKKELEEFLEEEARMKRLQQIIRVSNRLSIARFAQLLGMNLDDVWRRVLDWADQYKFKLEGEDLIFNVETKDAFIASLDKEFETWRKTGKDGKI